MFGIEQEYTFMQNGRPLGWPEVGYPAPRVRTTAGSAGGKMVAATSSRPTPLRASMPGLSIEGTNAEVMMAQWEFQIGVLPAPRIADEIWMGRWLLYRIAEDFDVDVTLAAKARAGRLERGRCPHELLHQRHAESYDAIITACEALGKDPLRHVKNYGFGIEDRLTGAHETAHWNTFYYGSSDRGPRAHPWAVEKAKKGWLEDRRPNANMDPYVVTRLMIETCCGALAEANKVAISA